MRVLRTMVLLLFMGTLTVNAQEEAHFWQLGVGYNFVDDSGPRLNDYFNFKEIWHAVPYPSRLSIGYYMKNGFGLEAIGSYNEYDAGKIVDGKVLAEDQTYFAVDGKVSYDLNKVIGQTAWFDPYLMTGVGYTWIGAADRATFNAGGGFNIWFSPTIGINVNSMGKWGLFTDRGTNHLQHSLGMVFRLGQKGNSVVDKVAEEVEIAREENKTASVVEVAEVVIDPEKDIVPVKSEEEIRKEKMIKAFDSLPVVYYAFNSSYLTGEDHAIIDRLVTFMKAFPEARVEIQGHADARGTDAYNEWLAIRRAQRIADYVLTQGITHDRITTRGYGETMILNHCTNGVSCSDSEHRENRRASYVLVHGLPVLKKHM